MKKKFLSLFAITGLALSGALASCGETGGTTGGSNQVRVLVPSADHGWTAAVMQNAQAYVETLNSEGDEYEYSVTTCSSADEQINQIRDVVAQGAAGVVILPFNNDVESGLISLAQSDIPFVMFDRIIENSAITGDADYVSGVKGDNEAIGSETAQYFLDHGLAEDSEAKVLVMPGDLSSVPQLRNNGFTSTLKENGWSDADLATDGSGRLIFTDYTNWSRDTANELFINWINAAGTDLDGVKYIFTHDSEISLGIIEALASQQITEDLKAAVKENIKFISSSSGLEEMYQVIRGDHPRQAQYDEVLGDIGLFDITYDPHMIESAIDDLNKALAGETVAKDHTIAVEVVDESNVDNIEGFGGKVS